MIDYNLVEKDLNKKVKKIILLIKNDYYCYMSPRKKQILEDLIINEQIVIVNQGISHFNDNTLAHGGRALMDDKIHFYPDVRGFNTKEAIETCGKILPHECFHYFIQPDNINIRSRIEIEMANFYTEGLVEKESRKFCKSHEEVDLREANYGYNINFVNKIQKKMNADSYGVIFSENDYLKDISSYYNEYMKIKEQQKKDFNEIDKLVKNYPINITPRMLRKIKSVALIDGNISRIKENFKEINNNYKKQENEVEI